MRFERIAGESEPRRAEPDSSAPAPSTNHSDSGLTRPQQAYYRAFLAALFISFSPLKAVAYVVPLLVTVLMLVSGGTRQTRIVTMAVAVTALGAFYKFTADEFLLDTYVLGIITHSCLIPILVIDGKLIASQYLTHRIAIAASWALLIEGCWGVIQALYGFTQTGSFAGANGDYVEGTIHPSLSAELAFGNPMFATNVVFLLLACMAFPGLARRRWWFLALGTLALVLASVVHVLVFMLGATLLSLLIVYSRRTHGRARRKGGRALVLSALAITAVSYLALDTTTSRVASYAETALDMDTLSMPRSLMLYRVFTELPDKAPLQPWIGLGPGQFCSRAGLMASGLYLGDPDRPRPIPLIEPQSTLLAAEYCIDFHVMISALEGIGSTHQPFSSLLTVYTELGLLGVLVVVVVLVRLLTQVRRRAADAPEYRPVLLPVATGVLFLVFLGFQQTYWEIPQAILVGCLVLKALHAMATYPSSLTPVRDGIDAAVKPSSREQHP